MMTTYRGWLLDTYPDNDDALTVWLICSDGERRRFFYKLPITFYVRGSAEQLRAVWLYLRSDDARPTLARVTCKTILDPPQDMLAATIAQPLAMKRLLWRLERRFTAVEFFNVDIPISLRFSAETGVYPLTKCEVDADDAGRIHDIASLQCRWNENAAPAPLRILRIVPDCDPAERRPTTLTARCGKHQSTLSLDQPKRLLYVTINAWFRRFDPDIVLTAHGDGWLFPTLLADEGHERLPNLNRDQRQQPEVRQANSMTSYGQTHYRAQQVRLFGRHHVDGRNAMLWDDYGIDGAKEQSLVGGLSLHETSRRSPGATVGSLQILEALNRGVLIPYHRANGEYEKTALDLWNGDKGGLVFQPLAGLHEWVIELDFTSLYPAIIVMFNLSIETIMVDDESAEFVPELGFAVSQQEQGLLAAMIAPLLNKRIRMKSTLSQMDRRDCRFNTLNERSGGLKWVLVIA